MSHVTRTTVDLSDQPNLVVIYLGMRVRTLRGTRTLRTIAKEIEHAAAAEPDGLLRHETLWYSLIPPHGGMRQARERPRERRRTLGFATRSRPIPERRSDVLDVS